MAYTKTPREEGGLGEIDIPLLADVSQDIAKAYGVNIPEGGAKGLSLRGTFIINREGVLKHASVNDLPVGRNVDEVFRLVQAFQFVDKNGEVCPAQWGPGKATMVPDHGSDKLKAFWKDEHAK